MDDLGALFQRQRDACRREGPPDYRARLAVLDKVIAMSERRADDLYRAISNDFGHRNAFETGLTDGVAVINAAKQAKRRLKRWMRVRKVTTPLAHRPGKALLMPQPLGVVGIMGPWNYPYMLVMQPLIAALAAGNRAMLKPSEVTPKTSALIAEMISEAFAPEQVAVVAGGQEVGEAFAALPFDHLFFTGSTAVGRAVAQAAARNLTPVTLELGGKSPCIVDAVGGLSNNLAGLVHGKCFNGGQSCIAPDYALVPRQRIDEFTDMLREIAGQLYPTLTDNDDLTAIVNDRHRLRLADMLDDARGKGAMVLQINPAQEADPTANGKLPLTLILNVNDDMAVMREEIFGPLLPIVPYDEFDQAIAYVNERPRPLALYYFGTNANNRDRVLAETVSGGVTVNDTLWHFAHPHLPFGGIGDSGMGAYHGEAGFRSFSHDKPVVIRPATNAGRRVHPPYGKTSARILALLRRFG